MRPVTTHGAALIRTNSDNYRELRAAAEAQADGNPYVSGVNAVSPEDLTKDSRSAIGAPTKMPQDYTNENFSQGQSAANIPVGGPDTTTGSVELGTSATKTPDQDPDAFQEDAKFRRRMDMIAKAASNANDSNNNRAQTGRLA